MTALEKTILAVALCVACLASCAMAGTVSYSGRDTDGEAAGITLATDGPVRYGRGFWQVTESTIDIGIEVGGETFTISEAITETFVFGYRWRLSTEPYGIAFNDARTVTFTANDIGALGPRDLSTLTLRFASDFTGNTIGAFLDYLATATMVAFSGALVDGDAFAVDLTAGPVTTAVPLPAAAWTFVTGVLAAGRVRRRLAAR